MKNFSNGELCCVAQSNGVWQVLARCEVKNLTENYYVRKVFSGKFDLKISLAECVHNSWIFPLSKNMQSKLSVVLEDPLVKEALADLTIDRTIQFGTWGMNLIDEVF